jgi:rhodanese-related sulfurtransferase
VRSPQELEQQGKLPGSVLIPLGVLRKRIDEVPREGRVVIYCKTILRAWEATRILQGFGYTNTEVFDGGILAWPFDKENRLVRDNRARLC